MRALFLLSLLALLLRVDAADVDVGVDADAGADAAAALDVQWAAFKRTHARQYASAADEAQRRRQFAANLERIERARAAHPHATFAVNHLADRSADELDALRMRGDAAAQLRRASTTLAGGDGDGDAATRVHAAPVDVAALEARRRGGGSGGHGARTSPSVRYNGFETQWDWRDYDVVTAVKNQRQCGSCWIFAAVEAIESQHALHGGNLTRLSEQQVLDCDAVSLGCYGAWPGSAYFYILTAGGLESEASYPYTGEHTPFACAARRADFVVSIAGWHAATHNANETAMAEYLRAHGPVAVCVDARDWSFYSGGVFSRACTQLTDHCVSVVGWVVDRATGDEAWIVRNSWGSAWGLDGYMLLAKGSNECSVASITSVPVVKA